MKHWLQVPPKKMAKLFYLAGILCLIAAMVITFAADTVLYASGRMHPQTITLADTDLYTLVDMEWDGADTLTALSGDVQLYLQPGQRVRTLRLVAKYDSDMSYERDLYWHLPGGGYTPKRRVWPTAGPDGSWLYTVPLLAGQNLRLDLADQSGVHIELKALEINQRPAWYHYFIPTLWQLFWLAVVPGLLACAAALVQDVIKIRQTKKGGPEA